MKSFKPKFSLELFENMETFEAEELKLITGGANPVMCSQSSDSDSGRNCSVSDDTDTADAVRAADRIA